MCLKNMGEEKMFEKSAHSAYLAPGGVITNFPNEIPPILEILQTKNGNNRLCSF